MALGDGRKTVTTGGTAVQLSTTSIACRSLVVTAETDNTGIITVGGSGVIAALATREGTPLAAGESIKFTPAEGVDDLNQVWLDTTIAGDGVTYHYVESL